MPVTLSNRQLAAATQAVEEIAGRRFDDTVFRSQTSETRRALRLQREHVRPLELQLREEHALVDGAGAIVYEDDDPEAACIDPAQFRVWKKRHTELFEQTFTVPHTFTRHQVDSGKEKIGDPQRGYKIIAWIPEPWIYDALGPILVDVPDDESE
jgi:hypothetical protein